MTLTRWAEQAACLSADAEDFDSPPAGGNPTTAFRRTADRTIQFYCQECPVKKECLEAAIAQGALGIRGGILVTRETLTKLRRQARTTARSLARVSA